MIVLDTHVLIWAMNDDARLGNAARATIEETAQTDIIGISAITPWEIALLAERGRLRLGHEVGVWLKTALDLPGINLVPIDLTIAIDSVRLPGNFHADPADRFIVSTARHYDASLVTADRDILSYAAGGYVRTINAAE